MLQRLLNSTQASHRLNPHLPVSLFQVFEHCDQFLLGGFSTICAWKDKRMSSVEARKISKKLAAWLPRTLSLIVWVFERDVCRIPDGSLIPHIFHWKRNEIYITLQFTNAEERIQENCNIENDRRGTTLFFFPQISSSFKKQMTLSRGTIARKVFTWIRATSSLITRSMSVVSSRVFDSAIKKNIHICAMKNPNAAPKRSQVPSRKMWKKIKGMPWEITWFLLMIRELMTFLLDCLR